MTVEYVTESSEKGYGDLLIRIEDTGMGVHEDEKDAIFGVFSQQKHQDANKYGGTGLGLAISKRLAEIMNGTITVESVLNQGSRFLIHIKAVQQASLTGPGPDQGDAAAMDISFGKACILLVDAVEADRRLISDFLGNYGIEVVLAPDMSTATEILKLIKVDLIIWNIPADASFSEPVRPVKTGLDEEIIPLMAIGALSPEHKKSCGLVLEKSVSRQTFFNSLKLLLNHVHIKPDTIMEQGPDISGPSLEAVNRLRQLQNKLLYIEKTIWSDLKQAMVIDEIIVFADSLKELAEKFEYPYLYQYADNLARQAKKFDMVQLPASLDHYPKMMDHISTLINGLTPQS